ncbi:hypothetical protein IB265_29150 [Ensifer sp. ENS10]|uniref:hypothetical protein n=1 Tax=Ensifer sp. ENS10 TaxID=2769286 RepID=UPI00177B0C30|nr:hypothetical protein [Ensifer sp. ENS10]MBD9510840.1 hypothetical protein [Ensifer sp. ENS10]
MRTLERNKADQEGNSEGEPGVPPPMRGIGDGQKHPSGGGESRLKTLEHFQPCERHACKSKHKNKNNYR